MFSHHCTRNMFSDEYMDQILLYICQTIFKLSKYHIHGLIQLRAAKIWLHRPHFGHQSFFSSVKPTQASSFFLFRFFLFFFRIFLKKKTKKEERTFGQWAPAIPWRKLNSKVCKVANKPCNWWDQLPSTSWGGMTAKDSADLVQGSQLWTI